MNVALYSEQTILTIKARAKEYALDNLIAPTSRDFLMIENAMRIGASVALEQEITADPIDSDCQCPGCGCIHTPSESCPDSEPSDGMTDVEADADTLRCAGWGTDEDYGGCDDRL